MLTGDLPVLCMFQLHLSTVQGQGVVEMPLICSSLQLYS